VDPHSLTYQELPPWLDKAVRLGVLSLVEAAHLWDEWLLTDEGQTRELPPVLHPAAQRLHLLEMDCPQTRH
jgi:hypothetical protein